MIFWCFSKLIIFQRYIRREAQRLSWLLLLPVDSSLPKCVWLFLFTLQHTADTDLCKKISIKKRFLMAQWSSQIVPEISLPPCNDGHGSGRSKNIRIRIRNTALQYVSSLFTDVKWDIRLFVRINGGWCHCYIFSRNARLNRDDATFVDVIHTDGKPRCASGTVIMYN